MRIGIVCPYSLDVPGGVQNHIRDLAEELIARGHHVSVLAPSEAKATLPDYVVPAGRAVPVPYNGAVGHVLFGPIANARVRRWLEDGDFDVVHLHEPGTPSLGLLALGAVAELRVPVVATFHMANTRSRAISAAAGLLRPRLERITARIAVSEYARETQVQHVGGEPVVIPNGLYVDRFRNAQPDPSWAGSHGTLCFIGRIDEPRKGLPVLLEAFAGLAADRPGLRLLVVGRGDIEQARARVPAAVRDQVLFLDRLDDEEKARALRTADVYVAPNTGGESFGIVLVEAMAAGAAVVASDLPAFSRVLDGGRLGVLFPNGDAEALAGSVRALLDDPDRRAGLVAAASKAVGRYDWSRVADEIEQVYETVTGGGR
jgi:phosphatidylinositol alpha-mannosyltransferase